MSDESPTQELNANQVAEAVFDLLREWPAINKAGIPKRLNPAHEKDAVATLLVMCETDSIKPFNLASLGTQKLINALITDFLAKLMGPMQDRAFQAPAGIAGHELARYLVAAEILGSHPQLRDSH